MTVGLFVNLLPGITKNLSEAILLLQKQTYTQNATLEVALALMDLSVHPSMDGEKMRLEKSWSHPRS